MLAACLLLDRSVAPGEFLWFDRLSGFVLLVFDDEVGIGVLDLPVRLPIVFG